MGEVKIEEWVVVSSPGGRYIGRPTYNKAIVLDAVNNGDCVELQDALDFIAPMRPVQLPGGGIGMQRDPILVQPDFVAHALPVYVKASAIYFCEDMQEDDKKTYKKLVESALESALESRARSAGLHLAR